MDLKIACAETRTLVTPLLETSRHFMPVIRKDLSIDLDPISQEKYRQGCYDPQACGGYCVVMGGSSA